MENGSSSNGSTAAGCCNGSNAAGSVRGPHVAMLATTGMGDLIPLAELAKQLASRHGPR